MQDTIAGPSPAALPADDLVLPFEVKALGVRGRVVRLGAIIDKIVGLHGYPAPVSALLGDAVALTAMLGAALKFEGKFILQTSTDGPVDLLVADFTSPGYVRGYARFDAEAEALKRPGHVAAAELLGRGHLAMTIDQGSASERYQGIVALDGADLSAATHDYFRQSEQIPTRLRVASGPLIGRGRKGEHWRAGAIMVQHLPGEGGREGGHAREGEEGEDDRWVKARLLLDTVEDHELLDPTLSPQRLLYRLFHEDGVTVYRAAGIERRCSCSRERVVIILQRLAPEELAQSVEDGQVTVTCQFCSARYAFTPAELGIG